MFKVNGKKLSLALVLTTFAYSFACAQLGGPPSSIADYEKAYKQRISQEYLNGIYIPKNLTDVFVQLKKLSQDADLAKFKSATEDEVEIKLFPSLGRWIIHNWGFYGGSRLSHYLKGVGLTHPEDMAKFLMIAYHRTLNDKQMNVKELVTRYKDRRESIALERFPAKKAVLEANKMTLSKKDSLQNKQ